MLDNMSKIRINTLILFIFTLTTTGFAMAYEEPKYKIIKTYQEFEIRKYDDRLAVEIEYSNEDSGFRYLFKYIAGANTNSDKIKMTVPVTQSVKIDMTTPVTQSVKNGKMLMQFFLPSKFTLENAPQPTDKKVSLVVIKGGYYAVIKYSGRLTNQNYQKHYKKLENYLNNNEIDFIKPGIRATYNGPFTLPFLRRNEIMMKTTFDEENNN
jgi:hypothetical protein